MIYGVTVAGLSLPLSTYKSIYTIDNYMKEFHNTKILEIKEHYALKQNKKEDNTRITRYLRKKTENYCY